VIALRLSAKANPAIDDDGRPALAARAGFQRRQHVREGRAIDPIAVKHLVGFRKAVAIQDQANDDLLAVPAVITRVPAFGLRVERALPFEVRRGQIVEVEGVVQVEKRAFARDQGLLDPRALGMQPRQILIERLVTERTEIGAEDVGHGRAPDPVRHRMLRGRVHQAVQGHDLGQQPGPRGEARLVQDSVELQRPPHLMAHMDRARFPGVFGLDLIDVHGQHVGADGRRGPGPTTRWVRLRGDGGDDGIGQERRLAPQRGRELLREAAPLRFGCRGERAEGTDRAMTRPIRGGVGLDEEMVDVRLAAHPPTRALDEHGNTISLLLSGIVKNIHRGILTVHRGDLNSWKAGAFVRALAADRVGSRPTRLVTILLIHEGAHAISRSYAARGPETRPLPWKLG